MALHPRHQRGVRFLDEKGKPAGEVVLLHPADARVAVANGLAVAAPQPKAPATASADAGDESGSTGDAGATAGGKAKAS